MSQSESAFALLQSTIINDKPLIEPYLEAPPKGSVSDRIAIYVNGFYNRFEEALLNDYVILAEVLGGAFSQFCRDYVTAYPSTSYSLDFLGQHVSTFLSETRPYAKKPFLAEIAAFEWAESQALISADAPCLTVAALQALPQDTWLDLTFSLHTSCRLVWLHWDILPLVAAKREGGKVAWRPKKMPASQCVLVWRREQAVCHYVLDDLALSVLQVIQRQGSFSDICQHLSQSMNDEDAAIYLVNQLYDWLDEHILM